MAISLDEHKQEAIPGMTAEFPYCMKRIKYAGLVSQSVPWHWHEEIELTYVEKGQIKIYTSSSSYVFKEGEAYLVKPGVVNMKYSLDPDCPCVEISHFFHPVILAGHFQSVFETRYVGPIIKNPNLEIARFTGQTASGLQLLSLMERLKKLQKEENNEFFIRNTLSEAWLLIMKEISDYEAAMPKEAMKNQDRLQHMISYIHRHYSHKITVEDIAGAAHISTREASRCFKKVRGKSPVDYLIEYRLSRARRLLSETDESITEIAIQTGFTDSAYFGKTFKKYFGITPKEYRSIEESQKIAAEQDL